jgi:hypothetical protein
LSEKVSRLRKEELVGIELASLCLLVDGKNGQRCNLTLCVAFINEIGGIAQDQIETRKQTKHPFSIEKNSGCVLIIRVPGGELFGGGVVPAVVLEQFGNFGAQALVVLATICVRSPPAAATGELWLEGVAPLALD